MADVHDNRAHVTCGGREFDIAASNAARRIYSNRFRDDVAALGTCLAFEDVEVPGDPDAEDEALRTPHRLRVRSRYTGDLRFDLGTSLRTEMGGSFDIPHQLVAAVWAMARAAGSTDESWDEFELAYLEALSPVSEDISIWGVCTDLVRRAFFREQLGQDGAPEPDEGGAETE